MALVRFGSLVQAASGALGAVTFSRQAGASIVRTRPICKPHASAAVLANQALFTRARAAWHALSDADRLTWIRAAPQFPTTNRLGFSRPLTPFAIFMTCALRNLLAGLAPPSIPSPYWSYSLGKTISIDVWPGGPATLLLLEGVTYAMPGLIVRAQRPFHTHPGLPGQLWRVIARPTPGTYTANIWPALIAAFGTPTRLEWLRFDITQWVLAWPRAITSRHFVQIPSVGDELVYNGDFQIGGTPPAGWKVSGTGALTRSPLLPYGDDYSAKWLVAAAQPATEFYTASPHEFPLTAGQNYTLRCAYKVVSGNITQIYYTVLGIGYATICGPFPIADAAWHTLSVPFTAAYTGSQTRLSVQNAATVPGHIFLDNLSIRKDVY